jgi:hypothetical protein
LFCLKIYETLQSIEWKNRNNFPFGQKFKFESELELKFLEAKLLLNLGQIYWLETGLEKFETGLEKSGKFPKILIYHDLPGCEFRLT